MAKVQWSAGIDSVSGALAKPSKNGQHSCEHMLLGTHRTAPTESKNCNRLYLRKPVTYTLAQTEDAINARLRFAAVSAAIKARKADLTKLTTDQITVRVIVAIQLVHRIAEQRTVHVLRFVLRLQLGFLRWVGEDGTNGCDDFRKSFLCCRLRSRWFLGGRVTELAGCDLTGLFVHAEIDI